MTERFVFAKEYWTGDSRDGSLVNGDGCHYYRMDPKGGTILEAFEMYESDEGDEVVTPMPEMKNIAWITDLGFDDLEALEMIEEREFRRVKRLLETSRKN
jgi:hypothetical protein